MPVGISSAARNLFLLGSSGADVVLNFFAAIDQSSSPDDQFVSKAIKYSEYDEKYILGLQAEDANSKKHALVEKRDGDGVLDWDFEIESTNSDDTILTDIHLDVNGKLIVAGSAGDVPFVSRYTNNGVIEWSSTTNTGNVRYNSVASDSNGQYYACGNTDESGSAQAFVEKYDSNGNPGWGKSAFILGSDVVLHALDCNSRGHVVAGGYLEDINSNFKGYFVKIDTTSGQVMWDRTLEITDRDWGTVPVTEINDIMIDGNDFIYIVGSQFDGVTGNSAGFICKYSPEGNMLWQKETPIGAANSGRWRYNCVEADTATGQIIILGSYFENTSDEYGVLVKYSSDGRKIFTRVLESTEASPPEFGTLTTPRGGMALDADPSFYYILFTDQETNPATTIPDKYTFGKVSSSGNGLGAFSYDTGDTNTIEYYIQDLGDRIGRLSDGSVRNDTSDLATNILNPTKIMFDDLATPVANKKRQMDRAGDFEYSGSPAIRPVDFQELNLGDETIQETEIVPGGNPVGQQEYTSPGSFSWTAPAGVTSVSVVAVGGGGVGNDAANAGGAGGGGGLGYKNNISVTPGQSYTVVVGDAAADTSGNDGEDSYFINISTVKGGGGQGSTTPSGGSGGTYTGDGGGNGGAGGAGGDTYEGGGGGAGGYSGNGGDGGSGNGSTHPNDVRAAGRGSNGSGGAGGGGGYGGGYEGGGVGLQGEGSSGLGCGNYSGVQCFGNGTPGSGGSGFTYGGGGAGAGSPGGSGAVRIIWGDGRSFPSTLTADGESNTPPPSGTSVPHNDPNEANYIYGSRGYFDFESANGGVIESDITAAELLGVDFTVEAWVRRDYTAGMTEGKIFTVYKGEDDINWALYIDGGSLHKLGTGGDQYGVITNLNFDGTISWYHIVMTHTVGMSAGVNSLSRINVYVNGKLVGEDIDDDYDASNAYGNLTIGKDFIGDIGEVRVYPKILSGAEAFQNYNATKGKYRITGGIGTDYELSSIAPTTTGNIVVDGDLVFNLDFGNKACFDPAHNRVRFSENIEDNYDSSLLPGSLDLIDATGTNNTTTSPIQTNTAGTLSVDAVGGRASVVLYYSSAGSLGAIENTFKNSPWTFSVYLKAKDSTTARLDFVNATDGAIDYGYRAHATFDLAAGTVGSVTEESDGSNTDTPSGSTAKIEDVGNGWYRCSISSTSYNGSNTLNTVLGEVRPNAGGSTGSVYVWGLQMENNDAPSRYIGTYGDERYQPNRVIDLMGIYGSPGNLNGTLHDSMPELSYVKHRSAGWFDFDGTIGSTYPHFIDTKMYDTAIPDGTSGAYTLEAWINVRTSSGGNLDAACVMGHNSSFGVGMQVGASGGKPVMNFGARSTSNFYGTQFEYNEWTHVVLTRDGTNGSIAYMNATQDAVYNPANQSLHIESGQTIGDFNIGYAGPRITGYFDGFIGEARVYDRALSAAEVLRNFNATKGKYGV